jgi:hypothetical protein
MLLVLAATGAEAEEGHGSVKPGSHRRAAPASMEGVFPGGVASLDGTGNNVLHPAWGGVNTPYARIAAPAYADGVGAMVEGPAPRYVSNRVFNDIGQNLFSENGVTQWGFAWGQFLDHTFGLRLSGQEDAPIPFDSGDAIEEFTDEIGSMSFERSAVAPGTGVITPRQQINTVSSYIDAWAVYGGTPERLEWLRRGPVDGDLADNRARMLAPRGYLPRVGARGDPATAPVMDLVGRLMGSPEQAVVAGDVRANENIALTAIHTLFVREHNRIVGALPDHLSEELKFQIARRVVMAEIQHITYAEFLPAMGIDLAPYPGYRSDVDASLSNEFAVVGYRAHSMIHGELEPIGRASDYSRADLRALRRAGVSVIRRPHHRIRFVVALNLALGNPGLVEEFGLDAILRGLGAERQYRNDEMIDNQLRSVLFQLPSPTIPDPSVCLDGPPLADCFQTVLDLGAIDIQRGRDHGIPSYNDVRVAYGLAPAQSFAEVTGEDSETFPPDPLIDPDNPIDDRPILDFVSLLDPEGYELIGTEDFNERAVSGVRRTPLAARLKAIYGDVGALDAFVGMLSEPHLPGSEFGELQQAIWTRQFEALRDGDRFFYLNDPSLRIIKRRFGVGYRLSLAKVITLNTDLSTSEIGRDVFLVR